MEYLDYAGLKTFANNVVPLANNAGAHNAITTAQIDALFE